MTDTVEFRQDIIDAFLALPSERPLRGIMRCLAVGVCIGIILLLDMSIVTISLSLKIAGLLITGCMIAFIGWGAERLWYSTVGRMFPHPLAWYAYVSRIPFWFIGGGIGLTVGLLVTERCGLLLVQDIPVRSLFMSGGYIGLLMHFVLQVRIYKFVKRDYQIEQSGIERS